MTISPKGISEDFTANKSQFIEPTTVDDLARDFEYLRRLRVLPQRIEAQTYGYGAVEAQELLQDLSRTSVLGIGSSEAACRGLTSGASQPPAEIVPIKILHNDVTRDFYMLHYRGKTVPGPESVVDLGRGLLRTCADPDFDNFRVDVWMPVPLVDTARLAQDDLVKIPCLALARQDPDGLVLLDMFRENCLKLFLGHRRAMRQLRIQEPNRPDDNSIPPFGAPYP